MNPSLKGIRVLDLTRMLAGPFATLVLADLGADVIKVEGLPTGDPTRYFAPYENEQGHYFLSLHRSKRSVAIDLHTPEGVALLRRLCASVDVVIENFRPGTLAALGCAPSTLLEENPKLVVCSISGFGQEGPLATRPAFDLVSQAMSGVMSLNGSPAGEPVRLSLPMGDLVGGIYSIIGILGALRERDKSGKGTVLDISMHDGLVSLLTYMSSYYLATGEAPVRVGSAHAVGTPYGTFQASDGYVVLAALIDNFWPRLARAIGRDDWADDPNFLTADGRFAQRDIINGAINAAFCKLTVEECCVLLEDADVPHAPIRTLDQVLEDPLLRERGMIVDLLSPIYGKVRTVGSPLHGLTAPVPSAPPVLGQHTREVLAEIGVDSSEFESLEANGVVVQF
jgi:crotonobetainyl-CoA:carnitine CoA-transferase CaiB-like acyl-CoA transferase